MGTFTVPLQVADPEGRHYETVEARVDSEATYTALPGSILERLGVVPHSARAFVLADGSRVERGFGRTWMRLNGREDVSPVVFWDEGAQPLLGAVTLEIFSLEVDPVNGRLIPVDASMVASGTEVCRSNEEQPSKSGEKHPSPTPSIALLNRRLGPSPAPRMLTPYEIELLRQTKVEIDRAAGEIFARKDSTSKK